MNEEQINEDDSVCPRDSQARVPSEGEKDWKADFVTQFVNDHGTEWRPLRGLWVEDVTDFIEKLLASEKAKWFAGEKRRLILQTKAEERLRIAEKVGKITTKTYGEAAIIDQVLKAINES